MDPDSVFVMVKFHPPGSGGQQRGPQTGEDGFWVVVLLIGWIDIPLVSRLNSSSSVRSVKPLPSKKFNLRTPTKSATTVSSAESQGSVGGD